MRVTVSLKILEAIKARLARFCEIDCQGGEPLEGRVLALGSVPGCSPDERKPYISVVEERRFWLGPIEAVRLDQEISFLTL